MKTTHLTPAILYRAADLIRAADDAGKLIFAPNDEADSHNQLYMCHAVINAAKDLDADVASAMIEFKNLLRYHGVSRTGDLEHINLDGFKVSLLPDFTPYDWATAQSVRFMFLEFLALSLE